MKKGKIILIVAAVAAVLAIAIGTTALAAGPLGGNSTTPSTGFCGGYGNGNGICLTNPTIVSDLLGITPAELNAELATGKTLVRIAATKGVTEDALVAALLAPHQTVMQQRVTAGTFTQAQADTQLQYIEQNIRTAINSTSNGTGVRGGGCGMGLRAGPGTGTGIQNQFRGGMMGGRGGMMNRGTW